MQPVLGVAAGELGVDQVDQDEVDVRAAGQHLHAGLGGVLGEEAVGEQLRALDGGRLPGLELLRRGDLQRDGLGGDHVLQRAALHAREHRRVDLLAVLLAGEDQPAARAAERLVRRRGDDVGVRDGRGVQPRRDEPGEVRHVDHEQRADRVGDLAELGEVELPRVRRPARDDHLGPVLGGEGGDLVHVDEAVLGADVVRHDVQRLAGVVQPHPVREVAAVREVQPEDGVAVLEQREVHGRVGLRPAVRLDVRVLGAEQRLGAVDRELLGDVDELAAAVVAAAGVALGVLVGQDGALRLQHRDRREVLRRDHLQRGLLAPQLGADGLGDLGVGGGQRIVEAHDSSISFS